jgi:lysophospholipase L1-like esterase
MIKKLKKTFVFVTVYSLLFLSWGGGAADKIKMAIIGDSMTMPRKPAAWPKVLQEILGDKYDIHNQAVNGRTAIAVGKYPYVATNEWKEIFEIKPHIIPIMLGTNDTKDGHWIKDKGKERFKSDYLNMVDTLMNTIKAEPFSGDIPITPKIVLLYPPTVQGGVCWKGRFICDTITKKYTIPIMREIAEERGLDTVNLNDTNTNNLFEGRDDVYSGGLHFNEKGHREMAEFLAPYFQEIKMEDFVGCKDTNYEEYSAKATTPDPSKCVTKKNSSLLRKALSGMDIRQTPDGITVVSGEQAKIGITDLKGRILRQGVPGIGGGSYLSTAGLPAEVYVLRISIEGELLTQPVIIGDWAGFGYKKTLKK